MPNHFDQAELIIQTESGDFAFVIEPAPTSIIGTMTDSKPFYNAESSRWAQFARHMRRPGTIFIVGHISLKRQLATLRTLDCAALVVVEDLCKQ